MPDNDQDAPNGAAPETVISVDLDEADPSKAVDRRASDADLGAAARDDERQGRTGRTPFEKELYKRMTRYGRAFDQKLANLQAETQRQISEISADRDRLRLELAARGAGGDTDHDKAMQALLERLVAANERGDSSEAAKITAEMARVEARHAAAASGGEVRRDAGGVDPNASRTPAPVAAAPSGPTPAGQRFIRANADWWDDPGASDVKTLAGAIYTRLTREEGYDANSPATFNAIGRELAKRFPEYEIRSLEDPDDEPATDEPVQRRAPAPAAGFQDRGNGRAAPVSRNRRTLTQTDLRTMRAVGLDPDNNDHVVRFLREQQAMEA